MDPTFLPLFVLWAALALVVLGLAIYRKRIAAHEDDFLHVRDTDSKLVTEQGTVARKLESIDKWGKTLTIVMFVGGLALGAYFMYLTWMANNAASQNLQLIR
jgi:hypothetical protein